MWGYYHPDCSTSNIFGSTVITPFRILDRGMSHSPALANEMLTYMAFAPAGAWYIALIELDANNNNVPDATESGYDPAADDLWTRLSCCANWPHGHTQELPDIYWGNEYGIVCWRVNSWGQNHIDCYDLHHDQDDDNIPDWKDPDTTNSWDGQFDVITNTTIPFDWKGILSVHEDLLVWTDARNAGLSGHDILIYDLDIDDDGTLNYYDGDFDAATQQAEFTIVSRPYHQEYPDIWWPFVVWSDRRNGNQADVYAYDLSLDSDGNTVPNWQDPQRSCQDPAEIAVGTHNNSSESFPEIWNGKVIWQSDFSGDLDIYGADLEPIVPMPRQPFAGSSKEKAIHWLDQQTVHFSTKQDIPGYIQATSMITRYKSFTQFPSSAIEIRRAEYDPNPGSYVVGFDFCHFGTPEQKQSMGHSGRGFIYDQALGLIVRTMLSDSVEAEALGHYASSLQNSGQLSTTQPGSFGFSFNGQGFWGEKDNFYDMDYLRGGANGWIGYGYLFYENHYNDAQFMDVITDVGDYILTLHYTDTTTDPRYGLFLGGYGRWFAVHFFDEEINWAAAEHNIDIYFFLRDLGELVGGDNVYKEAAELQKENMSSLWNENKGRFDQGVGDPADALDASSWGAMYLIATGDIISAMSSLDYADKVYLDTVSVSSLNTLNQETITITGYKPYAETDDLVWSEGSLGVALAKLKLGHALLDHCHNPLGNVYIQQAEDIVREMETLQSLDPEGGLFYAAYPGEELPDFPRVPSMAGTAWFLMVQQSLADKTWRDAFWSDDLDVSWNCPDQVFLSTILNNN